MRRPNIDGDKSQRVVVRTCNGLEVRDYPNAQKQTNNGDHYMETGNLGKYGTAMMHDTEDIFEIPTSQRHLYSPTVVRAIEGVQYIAQHLKEEDETSNVRYVLFKVCCFFSD